MKRKQRIESQIAINDRPKVFSFPPVADRLATVLILGSMPGERSLAAQEYYAHPQNAFWRILGRLIDLNPDDAYANRLKSLKAAHIALWDVLHSCHRPGSLDSDIRPDSITANDFQTFFDEHPAIERVCFNGGMAESSFKRYVLPTLNCDRLRFERFPSTSPANTLAFEKKLDAWRSLIDSKI